MPIKLVPTLMLTLMMGTLTLSFISAIAAALTVSLRRGGVLITLISLPMHIPVLIFATGAAQASLVGSPVIGFLALLMAFLLMALVLAPFAAAASLKMAVSGGE
jgi:heme exporter protein B